MDLKTIRTLKGITQLELMKKSGIHHTRISLLEKGHFQATFKEQRRLEKALDIKGVIDWGGDKK